jgi:hypothetical protein
LSAALEYPDDAARQAFKPMMAAILEALDAVADDDTDTDALVNAFRAATEFTIDRYRRLGIEVPKEIDDNTRVSFCYDPGCQPIGLPLKYSACTSLDEDGSLGSKVDINVNAGKFDTTSAFALPYVLLHETVCHVLQGPYTAARLQADASSRFAEGWMDVAAYRLHQEILAALSPAHLSLKARPASQSEAAHRVHWARRTPNVDDRTWPHRAIGAETAEKVEGLLTKRLPESFREPTDPFMHLSLALNAGPYTPTDLDLFVARVSASFKSADGTASTVRQLRSYLNDRDPHRFAKQVLAPEAK